MLSQNLRERRYPNTKSQAIRLIAADVLGAGTLPNPTAARLTSTGRAGDPIVWLRIGAPILSAVLVAAIRAWGHHIWPELATIPSTTTQAQPAVYFLPLVGMLVVAAIAFKHLWLQYPKSHINWNRLLLLFYAVVGIGGSYLLAFDFDEPNTPVIGIWVAYMFVFVLAGVIARSPYWASDQGGPTTSEKLAALVLLPSISATVGLCAVVGTDGLLANDAQKIGVESTDSWIAYAFLLGTLGLTLAGLANHTKWLELRRKVRDDSKVAATAAYRAIAKQTLIQPGAFTGTSAKRAALETGYRIAERASTTYTTEEIMIFMLYVDRASGRNSTPWADVVSLQRDLFEKAVSTASMVDYNISMTQGLGTLDLALIGSRYQLAFEQIRQSAALRCAETIHQRFSTGAASSVVVVPEGAVVHAHTVVESIGHVVCDAQITRLLDRRQSQNAFTKWLRCIWLASWRRL